ncbi:PD-(D/E)XK nuclease family protein, partial [Enterobacter kobei]|uniref:PD-(D/E)XK nuclease family protein n=1 Tax=Enterobacter kobei TaxID=208224 RepID=UPI0013D1B7EC
MSEQNAIEFLRRVAGVAASFEAAEKVSAPTVAPDFAVFDFIQPDEMRLSQVLAWLLNAKGSHAQG